MKLLVVLLLLFHMSVNAYAWDNEEMEIFDLVEEINKNFYEVLGLKQDASAQQIKKAFRALSVMLHPDKNKAEDANIQFRNIVAVYEVLKDVSKREKYNQVLRDGLPNWKSALYYYRRVRKLGLAEGSLIIFIVFSFGQYLYAWASFLEKKYTAEQILESKMKKVPKKKKSEAMEIIFDDIPSPSIYNTLPFQIPCFIWNVPSNVKNVYVQYSEFRNEELERRKKEEEETKINDMQKAQLQEERLKLKELRKRKIVEKPPEKSDADLEGYSQLKPRESSDGDAVKPVNEKALLSGGFWTDEDISQLISLVKKYSIGVQRRWETIADIMGRSVNEVTFMAAKLKENSYKISSYSPDFISNETGNYSLNVEGKKVENEPNGSILVPQKNWSQVQQKTLEDAIILYKNYSQSEKWIKIAEHVPDKTKEECQLRYKYLVQLVKTSKNNRENNNKLKHSDEVQSDSGNNSPNDELLSEYSDNKEILFEKHHGGKKKNLRKQRKKLAAELCEDSDISD